MKRIISGLTVLIFFTLNVSAGQNPRTVSNFNSGWNFRLGDVAKAFSPRFNDADWRKLNLPHDWAVEGDFSENNPAGSGGGALPGGIGWYRKTFKADKKLIGKKIFIDFDGVYSNSEVWLNGVSLGVRPYGYISFRYELTKYLKFDADNVIAVRVDNSEQPNSRWYSGCGIYRNVWLTITDPVHVDLWGTYVTTPEVSREKATVNVVTTVKNDNNSPADVKIITIVENASGKKITEVQSVLKLETGKTNISSQQLNLNNPVRWTLENPYLYRVVTRLFVENKLKDEYTTPLGIRTFSFDADKGFFLNGVPTKIKGVCMHHDLGCLGAAVNTRAIERQLQIMKEMGVNGIRTSHNPPASELLDLCDRMGFIVMDETFDMWRKKKTAYDYSRSFNEWHERDLTDHILRDRNHPSVFMWSVGNEVLEQWTHADADTLDIQQANLLLNLKRDPKMLAQDTEKMSVNSLLAKKLAEIVKKLDPTRPVTSANNEPSPDNHLFRSGAMDIIGFNYHETYFDGVKKNFPGKPFIVTESTSALMTRGYYRMPSDTMFIWPERWDLPFSEPSYSCSSYDNCHVPWGTTHEKSWELVKNNDFISGMYIWTGFDYIGEPTPFWYPAKTSYFGIVDLAGIPKDVYYMYQSEWTDKDVLHVFPHWNWTKGQTVDVWAYYNHADEVELFLNGISQGVKKKADNVFHVSWRLSYQPGTIKVVSRLNGREVLTKEIKTAGKPAQIKLTPDRTVLNADGTDLSFVTVEILDKDGNLCPNADNPVKFNVEGNGFVAGVDNGNQISLERFKASERKAFYGKCLVVIQNSGKKGDINLKAVSDGLNADIVKIKVR
ncbi:MAG TPA: glycoside hydrolase family 2 TIM barrel-domain containing protein [Paludibacteraceae bacterium]|nr:glycoside hydrolase family 2 TIM barrel-domain containing protein [Paludibacteraceae bacterium]